MDNLTEAPDACLDQLLLDKTAILRAARLLGDTWLLLIIRELLEGTRRFGQLQEGLGKVNPQTLSGRLKSLEQCGFITRHAYAEIPPRVEYALTEKGRATSEILKALAVFGETYLTDTDRPEEEGAACPKN
jgi:DNA-binding HxlR family transcriptional regulator